MFFSSIEKSFHQFLAHSWRSPLLSCFLYCLLKTTNDVIAIKIPPKPSEAIYAQRNDETNETKKVSRWKLLQGKISWQCDDEEEVNKMYTRARAYFHLNKFAWLWLFLFWQQRQPQHQKWWWWWRFLLAQCKICYFRSSAQCVRHTTREAKTKNLSRHIIFFMSKTFCINENGKRKWAQKKNEVTQLKFVRKMRRKIHHRKEKTKEELIRL